MANAPRFDANVFDVEERADGVVVRVPALGSSYVARTIEEAMRAAGEELRTLQLTPQGRAKMRETGLVDAYAKSVEAMRSDSARRADTHAPAIHQLSQVEFDAWIDCSPALIDFWAPWCVPCRRVAPIMEELASGYAGRLRCGSVNVDEEIALAQRFEVYSVPTLIGFVDGREATRMVGADSRDQIAAEIADKLGVHP
jgi:thioredoxin 1